MTYAQKEESRDSGNALELYLFSNGSQRWAYTTWETPITRQGITYNPGQVKLGSVSQTSDPGRSSTYIDMPISYPLAQGVSRRQIEGDITVQIFRGHFDDIDNEFVSFPKHFVRGFEERDYILRFDIQTLISTMDRDGLSPRYHRNCRHKLYNAQCGVSRAGFSHTNNVLSISGNVITISGAGNEPDGYWVAGVMARLDATERFIIGHSGDNLTINRPFSNLSGGEQITIFAGCDLSFTTCDTKFSNSANFGGFPFIPPDKQPWDGTSIIN